MKIKTFLNNRILPAAKKVLMFFLNPRLLLCVFIAWMITNGWSYVFTVVGAAAGIKWMTVTGAAYMGFLWLPFTPEKIVTVILAMFFLRLFFPKDEKTLGVLKKKYESLKAALVKKKEKFLSKKKDLASFASRQEMN